MIDLVQLSAITGKHGLTPPHQLPMPWTGAASHVYPVGDMVIKVPFDRPDTIKALTTEAVVAPIMRMLGVQTPEMIAFDDTRDILPVPFLVFRRVIDASSLQQLAHNPDSVRDAWVEAGKQIACVHGIRQGADVPIELRTFRQSPELDPRPWVDELHSKDALATDDTRWLHILLDRLAPFALDDVPIVLCHGDLNAANILVDEHSHRFRAIIDWAGAGWLDAAWDFAAVSLDVVPFLLAGHRSVAPLPLDHTAEARICWCQVQMRLFGVRQLASPESAREQLDKHIDQLRRFVRTAGIA